jgi:hypothetical protein
MIHVLIFIVAFFSLLPTDDVNAFSLLSTSRQRLLEDSTTKLYATSRRYILQVLPTVLLSNIGVASAAMENTQTVFSAKELTTNQAKERIISGQESLQYLLDHYEEIYAGGGDNIRRYLGTVGTSSGLYGITKVMKELQSEADDIVEYTETMDEINSAISGADGSAYMAIFTTSSTSGVPPEKYFAEAKIEVGRALKSLKELGLQLNLKQ